ncbi:antibiotic biosynthesis monooxygenase [Bacteroides caecigallinarum]|nr:antibiotic biosynthesis monooxygenase [Bacteroides caecigallinarum]
MKILFCRLLLPLFMLLSVKSEAQEKNINYYMDKQIICHKLPMEADGIVRLSKIEVYPEFLDEYIKYAVEVGEISLLTEPGVLTMYAVGEKDNPCKVTILETYASKAAYEQHIVSEHFQKYKQGTLHMVKSLLLSDQIPLNPNSHIDNVIRRLY